jgi:hypothetical protein
MRKRDDQRGKMIRKRKDKKRNNELAENFACTKVLDRVVVPVRIL